MPEFATLYYPVSAFAAVCAACAAHCVAAMEETKIRLV